MRKLLVRCFVQRTISLWLTVFVVLLLTTNYNLQTSFAASICIYPQYCNFTGDDPSSGQQSCSGSIDDNTGNCVWDPSIDPNCSECEQINSSAPTPTPTVSLTDEYPCGAPDQIQVGTPQGECESDGQTCTAYSHYLSTDENGQAWCDNNNCAEPCANLTPTPTPTPTTTPKPTMGPEEKAVYNMNQGLLPEKLAQEKEPENLNILQKFLNSLSSLFSGLFFGTIVDEPKMYVQSDNINQADVPQELQPKGDAVNQNIQDYLGRSAGVYSVDLPSEIQQINPLEPNPIGQAEKAFEQANFPAGINPITGQK